MKSLSERQQFILPLIQDGKILLKEGIKVITLNYFARNRKTKASEFINDFRNVDDGTKLLLIKNIVRKLNVAFIIIHHQIISNVNIIKDKFEISKARRGSLSKNYNIVCI